MNAMKSLLLAAVLFSFQEGTIIKRRKVPPVLPPPISLPAKIDIELIRARWAFTELLRGNRSVVVYIVTPDLLAYNVHEEAKRRFLNSEERQKLWEERSKQLKGNLMFGGLISLKARDHEWSDLDEDKWTFALFTDEGERIAPEQVAFDKPKLDTRYDVTLDRTFSVTFADWDKKAKRPLYRPETKSLTLALGGPPFQLKTVFEFDYRVR